MDSGVPALRLTDGSAIKDSTESAAELLSAFFRALPEDITAEGDRPQRRELTMTGLSMEEIEEKVMSAKPWKAAGEDGLPEIVWKALWPVVKLRVSHLFRTSLMDGELTLLGKG